jgi:hypothetical protein
MKSKIIANWCNAPIVNDNSIAYVVHISIDKRIIYFKHARCAGTSLTSLPEWYGFIPVIDGHGNLDKRLVNITDEEIKTEYFKFAVVRNPYDRIYSAWKYSQRAASRGLKDYHDCNNFEEFVTSRLIDAEGYVTNSHWTPQVPAMKDITSIKDNKLLLDYIVRLENFESNLDTLYEKLNFPDFIINTFKKRLQHKSNMNTKGERQGYTDHMRQVIANYYHEDFKLLGYDK